MLKIKRFWIVALVLSMFLPAAAQFKIGPRLGLEVCNLHFDDSFFKSNNRAGFTGGVQAEIIAPLIGIGADVSVMYIHRNSAWMDNNEPKNAKSDYIDIPINLKYKLKLPEVSKIIAPYIFTGPSFSFLTSKKEIEEFVEAKRCDISWNVGVGIELIEHLQIGASYGMGLTKALHCVGLSDNEEVQGKNRYWTITAAWLF